ncbi:MAG: VOC family protein [Nanoarchaeota archaeon]|nr:VOC family protein [Nanoarchaeota archaeon]
MKLNAVGVASSDLKKTLEFYELLGFDFPELKDEKHIEAINGENQIKLMIDSEEIIEGIIGEKPRPGNHSMFAIEYENPSEVDKIVKGVKEKGFTVVKEPWDAVWGQRYAIVSDPDGYKVDLYAFL